MKNYIANGNFFLQLLLPLLTDPLLLENGNWDTSKALVRRTLERCIHLGRQYRAQGNKDDEYEAFRLLGTAVGLL